MNNAGAGDSGNGLPGGGADTASSFGASAEMSAAVNSGDSLNNGDVFSLVEDVVGGEDFLVNEAMDINASGDQLILGDLLQGEGSAGGSLASFLHFTFDAESNSTIVNVSSTGNVSTEVDQQIVLAGVGDLTSHGGNSDLSIIASLLSGQLYIDV